MLLPVNWLRDFVKFDASTEELADKLTFSGLEVESIEIFGGKYPGVVAARVLTIAPHPAAANLLLCTVDIGGKHSRVVCGAHNFKVGDVVPFAGPGTTLPNDVQIEETTIRGELSQGMLCAEDELGISADHSGLLLLPTGIEPGTLLTTVIPPEPVLVIEVTPNRSDCLSIIGIAREVAALYMTELRLPPIVFKEAEIPAQQLAKVEIQDTDKCMRYVARALLNIKIAPSPLHIRLRLLQAGIRPINNVVDVTNYVMFEYGQPLHAFDRKLLNEGRIVVRCAKAGETMATLDGIERRITPDMLLITDAKRPVALAGVMGGAGSEIRDDTTEVLLESACFQPGAIRRTAKSLGLSTESSYRFERGVDPNLADLASRRATQMMIDHAGASAATGSIDIYPRNPDERTITCRFNKIRALTGVDYTTKQIVSVFHSLHLKVVKLTDKDCSVLIPSHRPDLEIEADLAEEVMRIDGLDKVPVHPPRSSFVSSADDAAVRATEACGNAAAGLGLTEILNYSFVSERLLNLFDIDNRPSRIVLPNPFSADQSTLRPSLIPQMASSLGYNLARQTAEAALFEIGRVFFKDKDGRLGEETRLSIGLLGPVGRNALDKRRVVEADEMFLSAKGILESLCTTLRSPVCSLTAKRLPWADAGKAGRVTCMIGNVPIDIGVIGVLKPALRAEWRMTRPVVIMEVRLAPLIGNAFSQKQIKSLAVYPAVSRDVALVVDNSVKHEDVVRLIRESAPAELTRVDLFDIYSGQGIGSGRKSLAYSLTYRSLDRTLTDEEANELHESVKRKIVSELKAEIRES